MATDTSNIINKPTNSDVNYNQDVQNVTSTEYGFKWKIIPLAIGVIAAISLIAVSILLSQNLQLYLGATLLVATSIGLYLACTENTEIGDLEQKLASLKADLKTTTEEFASIKAKLAEGKEAIGEKIEKLEKAKNRLTELGQKKEGLKTAITVLGKQNLKANEVTEEAIAENKSKKTSQKTVVSKDNSADNNKKTEKN